MTPITTGCGYNSPKWFLLRKLSFSSSTSDGMIKVCNGDEDFCHQEAWRNIKIYCKGFKCNLVDDTNIAVATESEGEGNNPTIEDSSEEREQPGSCKEQE